MKQPEKTDNFANLTLDQLRLIELRMLERRSNAKKLQRIAKQHRRIAYSLDEAWKTEIEELNRDLPHVQALIASKEAVESTLIPFPQKTAAELRQTHTRTRKRWA